MYLLLCSNQGLFVMTNVSQDQMNRVVRSYFNVTNPITITYLLIFV